MKPLTAEQQSNHDNSTHCPFCERAFDGKQVVKVCDHNHMTGEYRYALCAGCNLNYRQKKRFIPIFFHNLSHYDSKFIIQHLNYDQQPINMIPINKETYISFSKRIMPCKTELRFLDSMRFLPASIAKLAETLGEDDFNFLKDAYPDEEKFQLLKRKGVFCYDYMDCFSKLYETRLPDKEKFRSTLANNQSISDEDMHTLLKRGTYFSVKPYRTIRIYI